MTNSQVYFATHCGFYTEVDGMETLPVPPGRPPHLGPYPGGCVVRLDVRAGRLENLARIPGGEGVVTCAVDASRERVFCLGWPSGLFYVVGKRHETWDVLDTRDYDGRMAGEAVHPSSGDYRPVCRAIVVDPAGTAYWTTAAGTLLAYDGVDVRVVLDGREGLARDYLVSGDASYERPGVNQSGRGAPPTGPPTFRGDSVAGGYRRG